MTTSRVSICLIAVFAAATLAGCSADPRDSPGSTEVIRLAVLPDQSAGRLRNKYAPLLEYLRAATRFDYELTIPDDYADLLVRFDAGEVDLAWFGGLTFTQAQQRSGAVPLAFRDVDLQFTSCYLVDADDPRNAVRDFRNERFAFGPELSTSGHLMPRYYMERDGLNPDEWFDSVQHSAGHDQTALWVSDGRVAIGVANCVIVAALFESGDLDRQQVRVMETTPPYSDYVWAARPGLDDSTRIRILDAFLALDAAVPEHRALLRSQGANSYLPAGLSDFETVRMAAIRAGVLEDRGTR